MKSDLQVVEAYRREYCDPKKILFIDDDPIMEPIFRLLCKDLNCEFTFEKDARRGEQMAKTNKFDIVFLDVWMPDLNGADVFCRLREADIRTPSGIKTPIIMITGCLSSETGDKVAKKGCAFFVQKPTQITRPFVTEMLNALSVKNKTP